jgi:hypothetical protein
MRPLTAFVLGVIITVIALAHFAPAGCGGGGGIRDPAPTVGAVNINASGIPGKERP